MNVYLPLAPLPTFVFKMKGTADNILWDDSAVDHLNFANGLAITGQTVYIAISNHEMSYLYINLTSSAMELRNVTAREKFITLGYGSYSEVLSAAAPVVYLQLNQTDGNICLGGGDYVALPTSKCPVLQSQNSTGGGCEYDVLTTDGAQNASWATVGPSVKQSIADYYYASSHFEAILEDPNAAIRISKAAIPLSLITVPDGAVQVLFPTATFGFTKSNPN